MNRRMILTGLISLAPLPASLALTQLGNGPAANGLGHSLLVYGSLFYLPALLLVLAVFAFDAWTNFRLRGLSRVAWIAGLVALPAFVAPAYWWFQYRRHDD